MSAGGPMRSLSAFVDRRCHRLVFLYRQDAKSAKIAKEKPKSSWRPLRSWRLGGRKKTGEGTPVAQGTQGPQWAASGHPRCSMTPSDPIDPATLADFAAAVCLQAGVPDADARLLADSLVQADLWGHQSH